MSKYYFGDNMDYEVIYSKRKSVAIKIENGCVVVKAPLKFPKKDINNIVEKHKEWIEKAIEREKRKREKYEILSDEQIKQLKRQARIYFGALCERYAAIMKLSYNRITITSAKTRFGSCSSSKNISFSYLLMLCPEAAREYVVVHELAHLLEMNHSKRFYAVVEKYLPDYKARRRLLGDK